MIVSNREGLFPKPNEGLLLEKRRIWADVLDGMKGIVVSMLDIGA